MFAINRAAPIERTTAHDFNCRAPGSKANLKNQQGSML